MKPSKGFRKRPSKNELTLNFMGLDAAVRSGQFHEDPPLHPALLIRRDQADP